MASAGDDSDLKVLLAGILQAFAGMSVEDPEREFDYVAGAERSLEEARTRGWTVVSIRRDWATVFDDPTDTAGPGP